MPPPRRLRAARPQRPHRLPRAAEFPEFREHLPDHVLHLRVRILAQTRPVAHESTKVGGRTALRRRPPAAHRRAARRTRRRLPPHRLRRARPPARPRHPPPLRQDAQAPARHPRRQLAAHPAAQHRALLPQPPHPRIRGPPAPLRQIAIADLGHEKPTLLLTYHPDGEPAAHLVDRRMVIENCIQGSMDFFHLEALSTAVPLKIDVDLQFTLLPRRCTAYWRGASATTRPRRGNCSTASCARPPRCTSSLTTPSSLGWDAEPKTRC